MKTLRFTLLTLALFALKTLATYGNDRIVLVSYYSQSGNTKVMAEAVARGASRVDGITVVLKPVGETVTDDLLKADAIIVGSPVHNANVAVAVQKFLASWPFEGAPLKNKIGAAFVTAGGISAGEELTLLNILHSMLIYGLVIVGGDDWRAPFGASAVVNEPPFGGKEINEAFLRKAEGLGKRVAELTLRINP